MDKYCISIIIPHYNTPSQLCKLIKSIPDRKDIEIIVIDDNSSVDLSPIKENLTANCYYQLLINDSGIKGAGSCRNIGLSHTHGKWILFADSDDYFTENIWNTLEPYINSHYDIIYFPPTSIDLATGEISSRHVMYMQYVQKYHNKHTKKNKTELKYNFCTPWSKLIRHSLISNNNITFDQITASNDIMFITKCAYYSRRITTSSKTIYCVTRGDSSLTTNRDENRFDTRIDVLIRRYIFLRQHLSKKEFGYAHIDRLALGKIVDVFIEHWGISKLLYILRLYRKNHIRFFDIGLLNPVTLFHKATVQLSWWNDIKKHRR